MDIQNFNQGDIIVRVEAGRLEREVQNETLGISTMVTVMEDTSYVGEPMKLMDVCNGVIYLEKIGIPIIGVNSLRLPLHTFKSGWNYFVIPNGYNMEYFEKLKV